MVATSVLLIISRPLGWNTPLRFWFSLSNLWISLLEGEGEEEGGEDKKR